MKGVQCYELFGGIALENHDFFSYNNQMLSHPVLSLHVCTNHVYGWNLL